MQPIGSPWGPCGAVMHGNVSASDGPSPRSTPLAPCPCSLLLAPGSLHLAPDGVLPCRCTFAVLDLPDNGSTPAGARQRRVCTHGRLRRRPDSVARPSPRLLLMLHTCMPSSIPPWRRLTALAALRPLSAPGAMHACRRLTLSSTQHSNIRPASSATSSCSVRFLEAAVTAALPAVMVWLAVPGCGWLCLAVVASWSCDGDAHLGTQHVLSACNPQNPPCVAPHQL
jgi:hypothetical protein